MNTPTAMVAPHSPADDDLLAARKAAARRDALARRTGCDPALGAALVRVVLDGAPPPPGAIVAGFWPMGREIDLLPLLRALAARGQALALPVTPKRGLPLRFRRWRPGDPMVAGPLGTSAPAGGEEVAPDWVLVPLLAFDRAGRRLGYGGGYYDRTLAALPGATAIGIAYAAQEVAEVPAGPLDVRLPLVATEQELVRSTAAG